MSSLSTEFYITGGTLRRDAECYVVRRADEELHDALRRGEFCYALTARQMGKSSLMVRTAARLREEGVGVIALDLTAIGQNLSVEQWYRGLLNEIGWQLELADELTAFWRAERELSPLQRWMAALREVVLPHYPGQVVVFVDEIDVARNLPFSTDEFFAAIRECYNRRTQEEEFERLTFCLLGVAAPSDLIRDTRTTPFNIGRRIVLHDFTVDEAAPLAQGLGCAEPQAKALLERILYWTSGHPYLTQRLCQAVADCNPQSATSNGRDPQSVDRLCDELFFARRAQERDDNLLFVRERMLRSEADVASLLSLYAQVHRGKPVRDDETNPLVSILRLAGVVHVAGDRLQLRNRIYERVFDAKWIATNMPDAEVRRQRAAYRRGVLRTTAIALVVMVAMAVLVVMTIKQRKRAEDEALVNRRMLYAAQMNQAQQQFTASNIEQMQRLLLSYAPQTGQPNQEDLRGFEWYYLWRLCHDYEFSLLNRGAATCTVFSPDSKMLATSNWERVELWDVATGRELRTIEKRGGLYVAFSPDSKKLAVGLLSTNDAEALDVSTGQTAMTFKGHTSHVMCVALSLDGKLLATGSNDHTAKLWDVATGQEIMTLKGHTGPVKTVAFSPDGRTLATGSDDLTAKVWDVATGRELKTFTEYFQAGMHTSSLAFSPDGKAFVAATHGELRLWEMATNRERVVFPNSRFALAYSSDSKMIATGGYDRVTDLVDIATGHSLAQVRGHSSDIYAMAFSPDGKYFATGSADKTVKLWSLARVWEKKVITAHEKMIYSVALSPDDTLLATSGEDGTAKLWRLATGEHLVTFKGHTNGVIQVVFSPDGKKLATASEDHTAKLWDVTTGREMLTLGGHTGAVRAVRFSPDGRILVTGGDDYTARLWNAVTGQEIAVLTGHGDHQVTGLAFSSDGKQLATGGGDGVIKLWRVETGQPITSFDESVAGWVFGLAFSHDGRKLAAACRDGSIRVWDLATGQRIATLIGHGDRARSVVFSPDDKRLVSSGNDQMVKVWDLERRQEVLTLRRDGRVYSVAFSSDGQFLVASGAGTVEFYRAATAQQVASQLGH